MIPLLVVALLIQTTVLRAQFYLQDIHNTQLTIQNMEQLKTAKVKVQLVQSLDANMDTDNDFRGERRLTPDYRQMRAVTGSRATGFSVMVSTFSGQGRLTKTIDSTESSITTIQYRYDGAGRLLEVRTVSQARDDKFRFAENRTYQYDTAGHLVSMVQRQGANSNDSSLVLFKTNDKGQVIEEQQYGKGNNAQRIYYNYDAAGRLTDVLRYHPVKKRMLPDYLFEYDSKGILQQMTTVNGTTSDYTIWKYQYNAQGLREKEDCYGKKRELLGMIRYRYDYYK